MYLLNSALQALSLIAWYVDSPPTAHHGLHLANCSALSLTCLAESRKALHALQQQQAVEYFAKSEEALYTPVKHLSVTGRLDETVHVKINGEGNVSIEVDPKDLEGLNIWFSNGRSMMRVSEKVLRGEGEVNKAESVLGVDDSEVEARNVVSGLPHGLVGEAENGTEWVYVRVRVQRVGWMVLLVGLICVYLMHYLLYLVGKLAWRCCGDGEHFGGQAVGVDQETSPDVVMNAELTAILEEDRDDVGLGRGSAD